MSEPSSKQPTTSTSMKLPSNRILYKVQAASGLFFASYLIMHFASHYSLLKGWDFGNKQLNRFRVIYHNPVYETMLFLSLLVHTTVSAYMVIKRRTEHTEDKKEGGLRPAGSTERQFHRYAGYVMAASIVGHVLSTRVVGLLFLKNPELYDYTMIFVENQHFMNTLAAFLVVFGLAGAWHLIYGTRLSIAILRDKSISGEPFPVLLKVLYAVMAMLLINAILAATGHVYPIKLQPHMEVAAEHIHKKMTMQG
ncbi:hypothetical protein MPSEU_000015900 [Mayamaea pseudoterrestris]|nr:hypothetical protein MPSEU_000015900 [Mayamaea pseudoterrestris]